MPCYQFVECLLKQEISKVLIKIHGNFICNLYLYIKNDIIIIIHQWLCSI